MSKTLRELVSKQQDLIQRLIEAEGDLTPELEAELMALPQKVDACDEFISMLDTDITHFQARAKEFKEVAESLVKRRDWLLQYIKETMLANNKTELVGDYAKVRIQKNPPSVVINNPELVDKAYTIQKTEIYVDKKRIAEDLKAGVPVAGCHLEQGWSVRFGVNRPAKKVSNE